MITTCQKPVSSKFAAFRENLFLAGKIALLTTLGISCAAPKMPSVHPPPEKRAYSEVDTTHAIPINSSKSYGRFMVNIKTMSINNPRAYVEVRYFEYPECRCSGHALGFDSHEMDVNIPIARRVCKQNDTIKVYDLNDGKQYKFKVGNISQADGKLFTVIDCMPIGVDSLNALNRSK